MEKSELIKSIKEGHIVEGLMAYAMANGAKKINELPGLLELKIDDTWAVKCNGHKEDMQGVPALCWSVEYNGWPAGILSVFGEGVLCAGEGGNETNLRNALIKSIEET